MIISCYINTFDFSQKVYKINENGEQELIAAAPIEELADTIASYCRMNKVDKVYLRGDTEFVAKMKDDVNTYMLNVYGANGTVEIDAE